MDSEQYAVYPRIHVCFCYDCWERFLAFKEVEYPKIDESEWAKWLASNGYWFDPVQQIIDRSYFRSRYPGYNIRDYWLALRSANRLLGIPVPEDESWALHYLRRIDD